MTKFVLKSVPFLDLGGTTLNIHTVPEYDEKRSGGGSLNFCPKFSPKLKDTPPFDLFSLFSARERSSVKAKFPLFEYQKTRFFFFLMCTPLTLTFELRSNCISSLRVAHTTNKNRNTKWLK